jgi:hypothetical protein
LSLNSIERLITDFMRERNASLDGICVQYDEEEQYEEEEQQQEEEEEEGEKGKWQTEVSDSARVDLTLSVTVSVWALCAHTQSR